MKVLKLTSFEVRDCAIVSGMSAKRRSVVETDIANKKLWPAFGFTESGATVSAIIPTALESTEDKKKPWRIKFVPIACRCFRVCKANKAMITAIVAEFPGFTAAFGPEGGSLKMAFNTQQRPGVDNDMIKDADILLTQLIVDPEAMDQAPVRSLIELIREKFLPKKAEVAA